MIADKIIEILETELNTKTKVNLVPMDEAYPTSGTEFVRITGSTNSINFAEQTLNVVVGITVTTSVRLGKQSIKTRRNPYLELVNVAEIIYLHILTSDSVLSALRTQFPAPVSFNGRFTSSFLNLQAIAVYPEFYSSKQNADREISGFKLEQEFFSPTMNIPLSCSQLPNYLQQLVFPVE